MTVFSNRLCLQCKSRYCFCSEYETINVMNKAYSSAWCYSQGCQFRFGRCFIFSIGMKCFSFGVFRRAVSELYCSHTHTHTHTHTHIYIYATNIIQIQHKLIINYAIQIQCSLPQVGCVRGANTFSSHNQS